MRSPFVGVVVLTSLALVACQTVPEEGLTEQETVTSPTTTVTFPNTQVGNTSSPITIQINPVGYSSNTISAISYSCPDFQVQATLPGYAYKTCEPIECASGIICPLNADIVCGGGSEYEPYYFTATFRPTVAVTSSCQLAIISSNTIYVTLTGTGTPPPLSADVAPTSLAFGDVRVNTTSGQGTVLLRNTGGQSLSVSNVTASGRFSLVAGTQTSYSVAPGGQVGIGVQCSPNAVGATSGTLSVANNYTPFNIPLSCAGIDSNLDITPSPASIPTTRVGEPRTQPITLKNSGGAAMTIASVSLSGANISLASAPPAGTTLSSQQSATATVMFDAAASGDATGTLTITYDGGQTRTSQISARALTTSMSMTPNGMVDLGPVCMGQSASKPFQIVANEQGPFSVRSVSMPGGAFTVNAAGLPAAVQGAGANMYQFSVTAAPTEVGVQSAELTVETDIPGGEPQTTQVVVEGLAGGVNGSPAELDLGGVPVGSNTVGQRITITNCDTGSVTLSNARIEGTDAGQFTIVDFPASLDVSSTENAEFLIIASPDSVGAKEASFKVDHPGGTITISLTGDGLGEDTGPGEESGDDGRPSYYACSTGGSAAHAWPLAFALLLLRRRRA